MSSAVDRALDEIRDGAKVVDVRGVYLGQEGAARLADALKQNTTVRELWMPGNEMNDGDATAIADAVKHSTSLQRVFLHDNNIGVVGAAALVDAIKYSMTMQCLYFSQNAVVDDEETKALINNAISRSIALRPLRVFVVGELAKGSAVRALLRADGDHAVGVRVMRFLACDLVTL